MTRQSPDFDRLAPVYRWLEFASFGPSLWRCRCFFLNQLGAFRCGLILGDGDGRFTAKLLRVNPEIHVEAVDVSPAMLRALENRAGPNSSRLRTQVADLRTWKPDRCPVKAADPQLYDLVVTHFFLDCLSTAEVLALAARLRPSLAARAIWVVSEFAVPAGRFGRFCARPLIRILYWAFNLLTGLAVRELPDHAAALSANGFRRIEQRASLHGLLISELWTLSSSAED